LDLGDNRARSSSTPSAPSTSPRGVLRGSNKGTSPKSKESKGRIRWDPNVPVEQPADERAIPKRGFTAKARPATVRPVAVAENVEILEVVPATLPQQQTQQSLRERLQAELRQIEEEKRRIEAQEQSAKRAAEAAAAVAAPDEPDSEEEREKEEKKLAALKAMPVTALVPPLPQEAKPAAQSQPQQQDGGFFKRVFGF
jgi:hypothetical protein